MRSLQLHISKILLLLFSTGAATYGQTLEEDYNNGSINQRETDCWIFENFEFSSGNSNPINSSGGEKKHGATAGMDSYNFFDISTWFSNASMTTPFVYFDGTGTINFQHKAEIDDYSILAGGYLDLYLIDPDGNYVFPSVFDHTYRIPSFFNQHPDGPAEIAQTESVAITWTGLYRLQWIWNDYSDAETEYFIDDIVIDTSGVPFIETDTVCFEEVVQHTPDDAVSAGAPYNFEYTWSWVGTTGGTLTAQTTNDRTAQVDWNVGPGTYRLKSVETYDNGNCNGRTFYIDVTVIEQPNFAISLDTVCEGFAPTMFFDGLVGKVPFTVTYNDGSGSKNFTTTGVENILLSTDAIQVDITDVVDDNGCHADPALLIAYPIHYHPKPNTDPIYHY